MCIRPAKLRGLERKRRASEVSETGEQDSVLRLVFSLMFLWCFVAGSPVSLHMHLVLLGTARQSVSALVSSHGQWLLAPFLFFFFSSSYVVIQFAAAFLPDRPSLNASARERGEEGGCLRMRSVCLYHHLGVCGFSLRCLSFSRASSSVLWRGGADAKTSWMTS